MYTNIGFLFDIKQRVNYDKIMNELKEENKNYDLFIPIGIIKT